MVVLGSSNLASGAVNGTAARSSAIPSRRFWEGDSVLLDLDDQSALTCSGIVSFEAPSFAMS